MVVSPDALKPPTFVVDAQTEAISFRCGFLAAHYAHADTPGSSALAELFTYLGRYPAIARDRSDLSALIADLAAALGKE